MSRSLLANRESWMRNPVQTAFFFFRVRKPISYRNTLHSSLGKSRYDNVLLSGSNVREVACSPAKTLIAVQ
jgi:hypothetical protein